MKRALHSDNYNLNCLYLCWKEIFNCIAVNILYKISFVYCTEFRVLNTSFSCHENEYIYVKIACKRVPNMAGERADHSSYRPASFSRNSSTLITVVPRGRMVGYLSSDAICHAAWSRFFFLHEDKETMYFNSNNSDTHNYNIKLSHNLADYWNTITNLPWHFLR